MYPENKHWQWKHRGGGRKKDASFAGIVFEKPDSLWFRSTWGEKLLRSDPEQERGGAKVCSDPARRGAEERKKKEGKQYGEQQVKEQTFLKGWRRDWGRERRNKRRIGRFSKKWAVQGNDPTDGGSVPGTERGVRRQRGRTLGPGERCRRRGAGVGCFGWAERPDLKEYKKWLKS